MDMSLTKGLYSKNLGTPKRFGLVLGRIVYNREIRICKNAGWYNKKGEKLGWGDLETNDLIRIASNLQDDELFIILPELKSYWDFQGNSEDDSCYDIEYIAEKAVFILARNEYYMVANSFHASQGNVFTIKDMTFLVMSSPKALEFIQNR